MRIALDIPGGDHDRAPEERVSAALRALDLMPDLELALVGTAGQIERLLHAQDASPGIRMSVHEADSVVNMDLAGRDLVRFVGLERHSRRKTSIEKTVDLVRAGEADAALSAGNTGGIAFAAKKQLGMIPNVESPSIVTFFPTIDPERRVGLGDSGLVIDRTPEQIAEVTLVTGAVVHSLLGVRRPEVGILNNGTERGKGRKVVAEASALLERIAPKLRGVAFVGNKEPNDIFAGSVDGMGADGFDGNIGLKFAEGAGKLVQTVIKSHLKSGNTIGQLITWLFNRNKFRRAQMHLNVDENAAGLIVGPDGLVFKVHANADEAKYLAGILQAAKTAEKRPLERLREALPALLQPLRDTAEKEAHDGKVA